MPSKTNNQRALWDLTRGQRARFAAALVALAIGSAFMYVGPQIVRVAIDGILATTPTAEHPVPPAVARLLVRIDAAHHTPRALFLAGCAVDRKSTRLNSSHLVISYAGFCL